VASRPGFLNLTPEQQALIFGQPQGLLGVAMPVVPTSAPEGWDAVEWEDAPPSGQVNNGTVRREPIPGRIYNVEDAIQELGMTPEEALAFVANRQQEEPPLEEEPLAPTEVEVKPKAKTPPVVVDMAEPEEEAPIVISFRRPSAAEMAQRSRDERLILEADAAADANVSPERVEATKPLRARYDNLVKAFIIANPHATVEEADNFARDLSFEMSGGQFGYEPKRFAEVLDFVHQHPESASRISFTGGKDNLTKQEQLEAKRAIREATNKDGTINIQKLTRPKEGDPVGALGQQLRGTATQTFGGLMQSALGADLPFGLDKVARDLSLRGQEMAAAGQNAIEMGDPGYKPQTPEWYAYNAVRSTAELGVAIAGGGGSATAAAMLMGARVFGSKYDEAITSGRQPNEALMDATFYSLAEFIPERMAIEQILRWRKRNRARCNPAVG
jgi:hypothetical protein